MFRLILFATFLIFSDAKNIPRVTENAYNLLVRNVKSAVYGSTGSGEPNYENLMDIFAASDRDARERIRIGALKDLRDRLTGTFEKGVNAYLSSPRFYFTQELHSAMIGSADETALIDTLCLLNDRALLDSVKSAYTQLYGKVVDDDIKQNMQGYFQELLLKCAANTRNEKTEAASPSYNQDVEAHARRLINNGHPANFDEDDVITMLGGFSSKKIRDISHKCDELSQQKDFLKSFFTSRRQDDYRTAILKILAFTESSENYYADRFHDILYQDIVDYDKLMRLIIMEKNVNITKISETYKKKYGKLLEDEIDSRVPDVTYTTFLIKIIDSQK